MIVILRRVLYLIVLLIALLCFVRRFPRREFFVPRAIPSLAAYFAVGIFSVENFYWGQVSIPLNTVLIFATMLIGVKVCFRVSFKTAVFCCMGASLLQHIGAQVKQLVAPVIMGRSLTLDESAVPFLFGWEVSLIYVVCYAAVYFSWYWFFLRKDFSASTVEIKSAQLICIVGIAVILVYVVYDNAIKTGLSGMLLFNIVDTLCCFCLLDILHSSNKREIEEKAMQQMLREQQAHYDSLVASIDVINRRCHDLKYQISALRGERDGEERSKQIDKLEKDVFIYENLARTGNVALDNTFSERNMICEQKKIRFYYNIDGTALNFMEPIDIYVLFGNLIDNAIECVEKYEEDPKRFINLQGLRKNEILKIKIENYCVDKTEFKNNLPITHKRDASNHGIGTKSMQYIVKKYGGTIAFEATDNLFTAYILFPVSDKTE